LLDNEAINVRYDFACTHNMIENFLYNIKRDSRKTSKIYDFKTLKWLSICNTILTIFCIKIYKRKKLLQFFILFSYARAHVCVCSPHETYPSHRQTLLRHGNTTMSDERATMRRPLLLYFFSSLSALIHKRD